MFFVQKYANLAAVKLVFGLQLVTLISAQRDLSEIIHACHKNDPNLNQCLTYSANHLATQFRRGIPELGIGDVEPVLIDEINLALGSGPNGYRATFRDIEAYGVSNLTINSVRSDLNTLQFQLSFTVPKISVRAKYRSSGVLIMVQASGGGDYWGEYGKNAFCPCFKGVRAKVYIKGNTISKSGHKYLTLDDLKMDFSVKDIQMGIKNIHNGNTIIEAALNLFINSNSQELLKEMKPSIKKKLIAQMKHFHEKLFSQVPIDYWIIE
ncbi:hypothetical protein PGB90_007824 [Kerria lacca]